MTGRDFRDEYALELSGRKLPEKTKQTILEKASKDEGGRREVQYARKTRSRMLARKAAVGLAACLTALALCASVLAHRLDDLPHEPAAESGFQMVAYAAEDDVEIASSDGLVAFNGYGDYTAGGCDGVYTGALFSLEGDGIESVEFSLDEGELYLYAEEGYVKDYGPEYESLKTQGRIQEAAEIATDLRGEAVERLMSKLGSDENAVLIGERSHDGYLCTLSAGLRVGSQGSVAFGNEEGEYDVGECRFGFWVPRIEQTDEEMQSQCYRYIKDLSIMDNATLRLTIHFEDGRTEKKSYLIESGYLKCEFEEKENGQSTFRILPEIGDPETDVGTTTLYAIEVEP